MTLERALPLTLLCCLTLTASGRAQPEGPMATDTETAPINLLDPSSSRVLIAAHRGGYENDREDAAPENSLANIQHCRRKGYELFETDIQRTRDGHFVIVHDPTIDRETTGSGVVSEMNLADLKKLQKRYRDGSPSAEKVATLGEFLQEGKGVTLFKADLKPGVSQHFDEINKLISEADALDQIIFRVPYRDADLYERFREEGVALADHTLMFRVSSRQQVDDIRERFNSATIEIKVNKSDPVNERTLALIRYAADRGFLVETHAEGDEEEWRELIKAGVRLFHTPTPSRVQAMLRTDAGLVDLGMWSWKQSHFSTADARTALLDFCEREGITHLDQHISIKHGAIQHADALRHLLREAAGHHLTVNALRGEKTMFFRIHQDKTMADLRAIIAFSQSLPAETPLTGIKFDVEPYLTPEWKAGGEARRNVILDYLTFLREARALLKAEAPELELAVDIPFWWDNAEFEIEFNGETKRLAHHVKGLVDWVGIMSYRRDAESILKLVQSELEEAASSGRDRSVAPAMETGRVTGKEAHISFGGLPPEQFRTVLSALREQLSGNRHVRCIMLHHYGSLRPYLERESVSD